MSIKDIQHYKNLCDKGEITLEERLKIIQAQKAKNLAEIVNLQVAIAMLEYKEQLYIELTSKGKTKYKPRSFRECKEILDKEVRQKLNQEKEKDEK